MNCFSELDYSIYVDGESSAQQSRLIEAHLESCARCRVLTSVLRAENLLFSLLLRKPEASQPAASRSGGWLWIVASLATMAVVWQAASSWFSGLEMPAAVQWFNPSGGDVVWNLAFSALFSSVGWQSILGGLITAASVAAFAGGLLVAAWFARRWAPTSALAAVSLALVFLMTLPAQAIERRKGNLVTVAKGETVNDTLVVMAEEADIVGDINGDLIAFGRRISVRGNVTGDVICFTRTLELGGKVSGNVYSFAQSARIEGKAERNLISFVQKLDLPTQGRVGYDLMAFAEEAELSGTVGRDAVTFSEATNVRGQIGRNLSTRSDRITLTPTARVGGDFTATVRRKDRASIADGAVISGNRDVKVKARRSRYNQPRFYLWSAISLIGAWIVSLLLATFFPSAFAFTSRTASDLGWKAGVGFLVLVVTPVAACILCLTLIGLPLGLIAFVLWLLMLYLAKIFVGAAIAQAVFKPANIGPREMALPLLASLALIWIVTSVPVAGKLFGFLILIAGAGMVFTWWRSRISPPQPVVSA